MSCSSVIIQNITCLLNSFSKILFTYYGFHLAWYQTSLRHCTSTIFNMLNCPLFNLNLSLNCGPLRISFLREVFKLSQEWEHKIFKVLDFLESENVWPYKCLFFWITHRVFNMKYSGTRPIQKSKFAAELKRKYGSNVAI